MHRELVVELTEYHMILLLRPSLLFVGALKRFECLMVGIRVHCQGGLLACVVDV